MIGYVPGMVRSVVDRGRETVGCDSAIPGVLGPPSTSATNPSVGDSDHCLLV